MKITIVGYFGFANAGDEAILAGMLGQMRSKAPDARFRVICGDAPATEREHGVEGVFWQDLTAILRAIESSDLLVIGGGGLFHDYWGADPDTLLTGKHWGISFYASCALIAQLHGIPVKLYAVGVGPLLSAYGRRLTKTVCEIAAGISVRDQASKTLLVSIGVADGKIEVTADPAFSLPPVIAQQAKGRQPVLGVAIRRWAVGVHPEFLEREIARALDYFVEETGGSIVFIPFQVLPGEIEDDIATAKRVRAAMRNAGSTTLAGDGGWRSAYRLVQSCAVVLGMRLHSLIFAALASVPCVVVSYDPKVDAIAEQLSPGRRAMDVTDIDAVRLNRALMDAHQTIAIHAYDPAPFRVLNAQDAETAVSMAGWRPFERPVGDDRLTFLGRGVGSLLVGVESSRAQNTKLAESNQALTVTNQRVLRERDSAEQSRAELLQAMEAYRRQFAADLGAFRSQKAWQIMLAIRKAYTLFRRSKLDLIRFGLGALTYRFGSLAEYDLAFPDVRQFTGDVAELAPEPIVARTSITPQTTGYDVIVLGIIDFDFRFQRPQQIAAELARRGHRVFWVSPSRFVSPDSRLDFELIELRGNIWEVHLKSASLDVYGGELSAGAVTGLFASLSALRAQTGSAESIVYVQLPFWRRLALRLREAWGCKIVYDCMDDWDTFQNMGKFNVMEEEPLSRECDLLVVTGAELERKFAARGLKPLLVRNGADYEFFSKAQPTRALEGVAAPIVGYFGAIADWIDLDLVRQVAESRPQYSFVLIGQVFDRDMRPLEALGNVHLMGGKPYEEIPSYLYLFDACIIPFLLNPVTKATDPVKLYEYLSLGKPVVATDMAELAQCGDLIYIGKNAPDFAAKLDRALTETDPALTKARVAFAKANTWEERVETLDRGVRDLFPLVSILIVTHNSEEFVAPCLDSILGRSAYPGYEAIVVDNGSSDGTAALLQQYAKTSSPIRVCCQTENTGFAAGNNLAASMATGSFLIFLNIDTVVTSGWIHRLVRHVQKDPSIGLICPATNFAGNEAKINFTYNDEQSMEDFAADLAFRNAGKELDIQTAPLFCALVPRTVWEAVGELDVAFGMGMFEDDDFSLRVRRAGFRVATAEDCFIHHFGQGSFAKLPAGVYNEVFRENQRRFEEKWGLEWQPHRLRRGARPLSEDRRFRPATFVRARRGGSGGV